MAKKNSATPTIPSAEFVKREAPGTKRAVTAIAVQTKGKLGTIPAVAQVETFIARRKQTVGKGKDKRETGLIEQRVASRHAVRPENDDPTLKGHVIGDKAARKQLMDIVVGTSLYGTINGYLNALAVTAQTADNDWEIQTETN